jgi:hypothetical protein
VRRRETVDGAVGRFHVRLLAFFDLVALHPGAEIPLRHVVLLGTGAHAVAAADALVDVDDHAPPVVGHPVGFAGRLRAGDLLQRGAHRGQHQQLAAYLNKSRRLMSISSPCLRGADCGVGGSVAGHAAGVLGGYHLREAPAWPRPSRGSGGTGWRRRAVWERAPPGRRRAAPGAVASFAGYVRVLAGGAGFGFVVVAASRRYPVRRRRSECWRTSGIERARQYGR